MKWLFVWLNLFISGFLFGQVSPYNIHLMRDLEERPLNSQPFPLLVQGKIQELELSQKRIGFKLNYVYGDIASIHCTAAQLSQLVEEKIIQRAELIKSNRQVLNDTMVYRNRIKAVKVWTAPLPQAYDGTGVLIGMIDTGVDFTHPDLKDAQGKTRIKYLWDQVALAGSNVPQPYNYGIEWTENQINANLSTHSDMPYFGHGTGVCGIAAGNGLAVGHFEGVAPKSDLIVVALDFNKLGPTISDAVNYIVNKATVLGRPFVINASLGDYYGSHDATDLESKMIENMIQNIPGRAMVAAGGNAGPIKFHVKTQPGNNDTLFTWIKNNASVLEYWCYADTHQIKNIQMSIGANRLNYFDLGNIGFKNYAYALNTIKTDTLKHNNQRIGILKTSASINAYGVYEFGVQIKADSLNLLWRVETKGNGLQHAWNFDFVSSGLPNLNQYPKMAHYAMPDTLMTMVSGFQCSKEIITVANYVNLRYFYDVNNNLVNSGVIAGGLSTSSSSGPTRDLRQKPDVAATGDNVFTAMVLGMQTYLLANAPQVVAQGSMHVQGGGSSAASPVVAGLVALYLQKNPNATNREIISAIQNCAYSDNFTGANLPHPQWGYGKLDGKATFLCDQPNVLNLNEIDVSSSTQAYPNPFEEKTKLYFSESIEGQIKVYDLSGRLLFSDRFNADSYELKSADFNTDYSGLLLVNIVCPSKTFSFKLLKN